MWPMLKAESSFIAMIEIDGADPFLKAVFWHEFVGIQDARQYDLVFQRH